MPASADKTLLSAPFVWPQTVYYDATDAGGVVYHARYLEYMERARTEFLRALGYNQSTLAATAGIVFVVARADVRFLAPARFDDQLRVTVVPVTVGASRIYFAQEVRRDETLLSQATVTIACVDAATFRPARLPAVLRQQFQHMMSQ